ncbi:MAG: hypothetical protein ACRDFB_01655, partial [Rhabdochlamydiaceae bacterium]
MMKKSNAKDWAKQQAKKFEATDVKLPDGVEWYKPEPGVHLVDFMLYKVGKYNPRADEGFAHFEREFEIHRIM